MVVGGPRTRTRLIAALVAVVALVAAALAGEDSGFIGPLMESLSGDLLPRDDRAPQLLGVRLHRFDRAVERSLREWEELEPGSVAAR